LITSKAWTPSAPTRGASADSSALREFLGLVLPEAPPNHSTISRTRRLIDLETHEAVFTWILQRLADAGLVKGKTLGIDATTLEANAARAASCGATPARRIRSS
jgi:transposase